MPKTDDDLSFIKIDAGSLSQQGGANRLYDLEVDQYENASENDPDTLFEKKIRLAFHQRELKQIDDVLNARKSYANKIYCLVVLWLIGIGVILLFQGFKVLAFTLSDKVLLALIGGTTLNVLGIFTIVANFLFPKGASALLTKIKSMRAPAKPAKRPSVRKEPRAKRPSPAQNSRAGESNAE